MEVVDNKAHILRQIRRQASRHVRKLKKEHEKELKEHERQVTERTERELDALEEEWKRTQQRLKRQYESAHDLSRSQKTLEKQAEIHRQVKARLLQLLRDEKLDEVVRNMVDRIRTGDVTTVQVPKGADVPGTEPVLDELKVVAVISDNEEREFSIDDLLHENHGAIHGIVEELFA